MTCRRDRAPARASEYVVTTARPTRNQEFCLGASLEPARLEPASLRRKPGCVCVKLPGRNAILYSAPKRRLNMRLRPGGRRRQTLGGHESDELLGAGDNQAALAECQVAGRQLAKLGRIEERGLGEQPRYISSLLPAVGKRNGAERKLGVLGRPQQ